MALPLPSLDRFDTASNNGGLQSYADTRHTDPRTILFRKDSGFNEQVKNLNFPVLAQADKGHECGGIIQV